MSSMFKMFFTFKRLRCCRLCRWCGVDKTRVVTSTTRRPCQESWNDGKKVYEAPPCTYRSLCSK